MDSNKVLKTCIDKDVPSQKGYEMSLVKEKLWKNGQILHVKFLNGDPQVQSKVKGYAKQWENYANLKLEFGNDKDAEIRIAFNWNGDDGSWSYLGTDAINLTSQGEISQNDPTMHYGWLTPQSEDREYSRVVIHEFGHMLGCIHEHQNPEGNIPWDVEKVYEYYARRGWDKQRVDTNLLGRYSKNITKSSAFDPKSIMLYAIPNDLTIGDWEVGWNTELSEMDKKFIQSIYPSKP